MKLREFAAERGVEYAAVRMYISRHPEIFSGHTGAAGSIDLDNVAVAMLDLKYPLPSSVQVVGENLMRQLIEAQQKIISLQQQIVEAAPKVAAAEYQSRLLEAAEDENKELKEQLHALREQLAAEQAKSWWAKLRGK